MTSALKSIAVLCCAIIPNAVQANLVDGLTITGGQYEDSKLLEGYQVAPRWSWGAPWFAESSISISGFWEATLGWWHDVTTPGVDANNEHDIFVTSAGPTIQFNYNNAFPWNLHPYIEVGSAPSMSTNNLSNPVDVNNFNIEDKIGAGFLLGAKKDLQLGYRYVHYTNQTIAPGNTSLDMHTINLTWLFS